MTPRSISDHSSGVTTRGRGALAQPAGQRADDAQDALPMVADRLLAGDQLVICACRRGGEAAQRLHGSAGEGNRRVRIAWGDGVVHRPPHVFSLLLMFLSPARG